MLTIWSEILREMSGLEFDCGFSKKPFFMLLPRYTKTDLLLEMCCQI